MKRLITKRQPRTVALHLNTLHIFDLLGSAGTEFTLTGYCHSTKGGKLKTTRQAWFEVRNPNT